MLSLSCNTDVSLDLFPMLEAERRAGRKIVSIAQVHADLPFLYGRAMVPRGTFDLCVRNPKYDTTLFATPNMSVNLTDFAIGTRASALIRDGERCRLASALSAMRSFMPVAFGRKSIPLTEVLFTSWALPSRWSTEWEDERPFGLVYMVAVRCSSVGFCTCEKRVF